MTQYIKKSALVAELNKKKIPFKRDIEDGNYPTYLCAIMDFEDFIDTLEVKEVEEEPECKIFPRPIGCYSTCKECPLLAANNKTQKRE